MTEDSIDSKSETELGEGASKIRITLNDVKQMRNALLTALKQSKVGDREVLIGRTSALPGWIDIDGRAMLGGWLLQSRKGELVATYRLSENKERVVGYAATFEKSEKNGWQVTRLVSERVSSPR